MVSIHPVTDLVSLLSLEQVKPDAYLGAGPVLGWGRIYGGQVVAQALRAASLTVDDSHRPQSLHAYFVRAGDEHQTVLYEVERVRDSRSFATRQVVAYQAGGAILNLIASFHAHEPSIDVDAERTRASTVDPAALPEERTDLLFERRMEWYRAEPEPAACAWIRVRERLPDDETLHACAFAYLSDEFPLGVALGAHPLMPDWSRLFTASLDHAVWFHRSLRADEWLQFDLRGGGVADARGGWASPACSTHAGVTWRRLPRRRSPATAAPGPEPPGRFAATRWRASRALYVLPAQGLTIRDDDPRMNSHRLRIGLSTVGAIVATAALATGCGSSSHPTASNTSPRGSSVPPASSPAPTTSTGRNAGPTSAQLAAVAQQLDAAGTSLDDSAGALAGADVDTAKTQEGSAP